LFVANTLRFLRRTTLAQKEKFQSPPPFLRNVHLPLAKAGLEDLDFESGAVSGFLSPQNKSG
jgi:hypothetical protein